jgi:hypothetical protein
MWTQAALSYIQAEYQISHAAYEKTSNSCALRRLDSQVPEHILEPSEKDELFLITQLKSCH